MAASLLCAPVVYPWYLLWLLPFVRSASTVPIIIWTVSIIPTYYVWHLRTLGRPVVGSWLDYAAGIWIAWQLAGAIIGFRRISSTGRSTVLDRLATLGWDRQLDVSRTFFSVS